MSGYYENDLWSNGLKGGENLAMNKKMLKIKLPKLYSDNIVEFEEDMDDLPSLSEWISEGRSVEEYNKVQILLRIENSKALLKENLYELSSEEIREIRDGIKKMIEEYNEV